MEFCSGKNLYNVIKEAKNNKQKLNENFIWELFIKICIGICNLNKSNIIHGKLKPSNVFIANDGNIKLGNFGFLKLLNSTNEDYDKNIDNFGLGCILYGLSKLDYYNDNIISIKDKIIKENDLIDSKLYSENINKAIKQLFENEINIQNFLVHFILLK